MNLSSTADERIVTGTSMARFIPFQSIVDPGVICTRDGDLVASWRIAGIDCTTSSPETIRQLHEIYCQTVHAAGRERIGFWTHRIRRRVQTNSFDTPSPLTPRAAEIVLAAHQEQLRRTGLFSTELYLTAVLRPDWGLRTTARRRSSVTVSMQADIERFRDVTRTLQHGLERFGPERLGEIESGRGRYSSQMRLYGHLLNGVDEPMPVPWGPIPSALATSRLCFARERILVQGATRSRTALVLDLKQYPPTTQPGVLDGIFDGPYEAVETQSFSPLSRAEAERYLERQRNQLISSGDASGSQITEIAHAVDGVASSDFVLGEFHYSAVIFGASFVEAAAGLAAARVCLNEAGFQSALIDLIPDLAWFAQLPCNWKYRPRSARVSSRIFCALSPLHRDGSGKRVGNPWGEAVATFKGPGRSPVYFNFHSTPEGSDATDERAPGNTLIIGQTGSGKTVLELFLLANAFKYSPRIMLFDKDRSTEIAMRAFGARYTVFERGSPTGINPLQWDPTEQNLAFMGQWVASLIGTVPVTARESLALSRAIETISKFPRSERRLSVLVQNIPIGEEALLNRLARWCKGSSLGWAFDTTPDLAESSDRIRSFDLTAYFDSRELMTPVMLALLQKLDEWLDGTRFIYVVTEFWKALDDPLFADFVKNKQKTIRKQNGLGIFDTQSPRDLLASQHAAAIIEQTATTIFLPNPLGSYDDYCGGLKCSKREFELIRALAPGDRKFLVKQGDRSYLASLDLSSRPSTLSLLSSNTQSVRILDEIREKVGDDFERWWSPFQAEIERRRGT